MAADALEKAQRQGLLTMDANGPTGTSSGRIAPTRHGQRFLNDLLHCFSSATCRASSSARKRLA